MKALLDPRGYLAEGLKRLRAELDLADGFDATVLAEAREAAGRPPQDHRDRTEWPFVTLDPASSTDLDQAFHIEQAGGDLLLHYAIADVGWFVRPGSALDREAWRRGTTQYMPGGRVPLYPAMLGEDAASLLPDGPRPAVVFSVAIASDGKSRIEGVERSIIRSRAKLGYETVRPKDLPPLLGDLARRIRAAEHARGAERLEAPEQELTRDASGRYTLMLRPSLPAEQDNAALSLAANLAVAQLFIDHHGGLFRVLAEPDARAIARLRISARMRGIAWGEQENLAALERRLDVGNLHEAGFLLEIRKASRGASYAPWTAGEKPWHAAVAASYVHGTAPLRRLADRYVVEAALALGRTGKWPDGAAETFRTLPPVMEMASQTAHRLDRAVLDLAEAVLLEGREGEEFAAVVTEVGDRGAYIQLIDLPVTARIASKDLKETDAIRVRLDIADPEKRRTQFSLVGNAQLDASAA
ncbi:RNB domain-containing ribonuclease [Manganibacter manganicus]|uniref:RNB domain-containing ribonuclease n=1 Tax=Manganibacter manganicus TaxID=1873176 RepID=A0A1V8RTL4_9HYPH|nr:RNB domain-containing ribonuclease [Pseudaminobacter manganicus]OQM76473.1 RNB domain-containing ribonuclease [Pseudaminobacter manganicus]